MNGLFLVSYVLQSKSLSIFSSNFLGEAGERAISQLIILYLFNEMWLRSKKDRHKHASVK
jgi:hypothetical protein